VPTSTSRNSVRIIGGAWRGRRIEFPDLPGLRPTPNRVRETLFNWLQFRISGLRCLDLFAGSGALGLEALSRGAAEVVFVETSPAAAQALRAQLKRLGGEARSCVLEMGAARYLRAPGEAFDLVFLDPPFGQNVLPDCLAQLSAGHWLKPGAQLYLESARAPDLPPLPAGWQALKSKTAGQVGYHLVQGVSSGP
jgi:16S rRNA (guanine966-N2)-methyltransferase